MKKALIVANLAGFAGFLINDIKLLQKKGYQITYAANARQTSWSDTKLKLDELSVEVVHIDFNSKNPFSKENIRAYKQIGNLLKEKQFDVIHCHTPISGIITRIAARKYRRRGSKVIYTTHGFAFTSHSSKKTWLVYGLLEKIGSIFCDAIITINKEDFLNAKRMFCKNVFLINGVGVDTEQYKNVQIERNTYRKSIGVEDNKIMVLSVGELSVRKNHIVIIDAIAELENKEKYVYVICGNGINGGTGNLLRQRAVEKGVNLKLLGFRFDIPEITACSDIGAIPSIREGLGLAGIQSLSAGIPLVGTDVQGIRDYVINGETGYVCNPFDVSAFATAIVKLSNDKTRETMRKKCYDTAQKFDKSMSNKQMEEIYASILK